jgi:two-component system, LuxR family, response regulator FixJ
VTQAPATIHIVDDDESLRTALMRLLRAAGYAVRTYASAGDFLLNKPANAPGCVVLDVRMPGPTGFELQEAIVKLDESLPIIFLTGHGDIPMSVRAIKAGAVDFLTKPVRKETLLQAVRTALAGSAERCATRELLHSLRSRYESLTPREREVFEQVASGKLNKQIAGELGTCERTVKAHRAHVMEKMQLTSVAELVHAVDQLIGCGITTLPR